MLRDDVSFMVTVYNKRRYLPLVIQSIRSQRGISPDAEYIFVDDGSTDGSYELLQDLTRGWSNVKLIAKTNGGQTSAFNAGLRAVTRPYIKLWDADDYAHPDLTVKLIEAVEKTGTDLGFCRIDYSPFDGPDDPDAIIRQMDSIIIEPCRIFSRHIMRTLKNPQMNPTSLLITRRLIESMGLIDERISIPDVYLTYAASLQTDFVELPGTYAFAFKDVPGRLTNNESQILHDINGALYCFYDNFYESIPRAVRRYVGQRSAGRAWKWARRHNGMGIFSTDFRRFAKSRISPFPLSKEELYGTLLPFRKNNPIRTKL